MREAQGVVVLGPDHHRHSCDVPGPMLVVLAVRTVFPDGEHLIRLEDPDVLRGRDALVLQSTGPPQDRNYLTLLQMVAATRDAGAARITCFVPYLCYQRQDRRMRPGEAVTGSLVLSVLSGLGVDLVLTVEKHSAAGLGAGGLATGGLATGGLATGGLATGGLGAGGLATGGLATGGLATGGPRAVSLAAAPAFARFAADHGLAVDLVVSPDRGGRLRAGEVARLLGVGLITLDKHRSPANGTFYGEMPAELAGRHCLVVDDLCSSGSTLQPLCAALRQVDARVSVFVTHLLSTPDALRARVPEIETLAYSDSCGHETAPIRLLPLALAAWADHAGWPGDRRAGGGLRDASLR
jgi:ribose-phosphate pyrophosphokinase